MSTLAHRLGLGSLLLVAGIQLWPSGRANPAVTSAPQAPSEVERILRESCYDCHSNETRWPWYGYVAPVSWFLVHDVDEGRAELNFSTWGELPPERRAKRAEKAIEEIEEGKMPLKKYVRMHGEAEVTSEELDVLRRWARAQGG